MSLPRYESYKDSGVEWLGEVPEHWLVFSLKRIIAAKSGTDAKKDDGEIPLFGANGKIGFAENVSQPNGAILVGRVGSAGSVIVTYEACAVSDNALIISPLKNINSLFLYFVLISLDLASDISKNAQPLITATALLNKKIVFPLYDSEIDNLAYFLNQETAKIDNLIAEQQQLIKLLKEKRQAVISHAVTKGLNPDVPMKDSGIEWLGEVPEHWSLVPLKVLISKIESGKSVNAIDVPAEANEIGVLKTSCVYGGKFNPSENKTVIDAEINLVSCPLKEGMLIVSRMNTPELVGATGYVSNAPGNIYLPDRLWQIHFDKTNEKFIYFWTLSCFYRAYIKSVCTGTSSSMQNLSQEQFKSFLLVVPNEKEQATVADFLDQETTTIDTLIAESTNLISLSKERRSALISSAVTGKIDVRNYVSTQPQVEAMV